MSRRNRSRRSADLWSVPLSVRWGDMDALGHINNCEYFRYAESARLAFFDEVLRDIEVFTGGSGPILADIGCAFHEQMRYPADIDVGVRITRIGSSSFDVHTPVFLRGQDRAVADLHAVLVWFDYEKQQAATVPDVLRQWLVPEDEGAPAVNG